MGAYILRRLGYMLVTLVLVTIVGFVIIELPPGSYLEFEIQRLRMQGGDMSHDQILALEKEYGVHDPVYVKFWKWASGFVRGDFGLSFEYRQPVGDIIWARLGWTVAISSLTMLTSWLISIPIGVYSATHRYKISDYLITALQFVGLSVPAFLLALVLMVFLNQVLGVHVGGLFSTEYRDAPWSLPKLIDLAQHLVVPVIVVGVSNTAWNSRVMRANLLDVLGMQYVQTARAKGVHERRVVWKHAVRNAIHPLIMVLGMSLPAVISGGTVVDIVLNLPTVGPILFRSLLQQDMYLAGTLIVFLSFFLIIGNLFADIILAWVDPRVRFD